MFETAKRERSFKQPSNKGSEYPELHRLIRPHIDSFNAIFSQGLLQKALHNIEPVIVRDTLGKRLSGRLQI